MTLSILNSASIILLLAYTIHTRDNPGSGGTLVGNRGPIELPKFEPVEPMTSSKSHQRPKDLPETSGLNEPETVKDDNKFSDKATQHHESFRKEVKKRMPITRAREEFDKISRIQIYKQETTSGNSSFLAVIAKDDEISYRSMPLPGDKLRITLMNYDINVLLFKNLNLTNTELKDQDQSNDAVLEEFMVSMKDRYVKKINCPASGISFLIPSNTAIPSEKDIPYVARMIRIKLENNVVLFLLASITFLENNNLTIRWVILDNSLEKLNEYWGIAMRFAEWLQLLQYSKSLSNNRPEVDLKRGGKNWEIGDCVFAQE